MGVRARGCRCPDPDKGFGKVGGCGLPSAERGEESTAGRVRDAGSLPACCLFSWYCYQKGASSPKDLEGYLLWFQSISLKTIGLGGGNID